MLSTIKTEITRVSLAIASEHSPVTFPNNADIILSWCYSFMYDHNVESTCFYIAKMINELILKENPDLTLIIHLIQQVLDLQFFNANKKRAELGEAEEYDDDTDLPISFKGQNDWFLDKPLNIAKMVSAGLLTFSIPDNSTFVVN